MFGSHLSIAGSMANALREAKALGLDTVQVFTKNQQQWKAPPLTAEVVREWRSEVARLGWGPSGDSPGRTVSHASYLINLASPNDELWRKSVDLMREEIERCETLGIPYLVHHPGAATGSPVPDALGRIAAAYRELFASTKGYRTVSCLENTVGSGSNLGRTLEELAELRRRIVDATAAPGRVGFCVDTCHLHAAGYDLGDRKLAAGVLDECDRVCGLANLRVVHMNDSKAGAGSRRDLHAHIGEGTIGKPPGRRARLAETGFAAFVNRPELRDVPKILETPKGESEPGKPWDLANLRRLKGLIESPIRPIKGKGRASNRPGRPRVGPVGRARATTRRR